MLAVKLHRKKRPWLGRGSHLVPVLRWDYARIRIKNWIRTLESSRWVDNHTIRYVTLVRIPDDHPVGLQCDWIEKAFGFFSGESVQRDSQGRWMFPTLREVPQEYKEELLRWSDPEWTKYISGRVGGPFWTHPEVILGAPLPASRILWTKSRLLLYRGDQRGAGG